MLGSVNSNSNQRTSLKILNSQYASKKSLTPGEFLDFLDSYGKPSNKAGPRAFGIMGTPTIRKESDLISMARKTKTLNSENVSITASQQTCIVQAIYSDKFGKPIPPIVAEKIADNLGAFTDYVAQRKVAWAIGEGKFGFPTIPEDVAENIAENFGAFTDSEAQKTVANAIRKGRFGKPIPMKVLEKLAVFTDSEAQKTVANAIKNGQLGEPIPEKVLENLAVFTDPEDQRWVADAILSGRFGETTNPEDVAKNIAEKLGAFTDPNAQRKVANAIHSGRFGEPTIPEEVAKNIAENFGAFTDPEAQRNVANAIKEGRLGNPIPENVAQKIAENLGGFTDSEAQKTVANAIYSGKFGDKIPEGVAEKIAENFGAFTDPEALRSVFKAINSGRFGVEILKEVEKNINEKLDRLEDFNDQKVVAVAIDSGIFGEPIPEDVAQKIAEKLGAFKDPDAQISVAKAISNSRLFGNPIPENVAQKIAEKLDVFTEPAAQRVVAGAIHSGRFGETTIPEEVAKNIAENFGVFEDPNAQRLVARAIRRGIFGFPTILPSVAQKIAENLGGFEDPDAIDEIVSAINSRRFGDPIPEGVAKMLISNTSFELFRLIHVQLTEGVSDSLDLKYNTLALSEQTTDIDDKILISHITAPLGQYIININDPIKDDEAQPPGTIHPTKIAQLLENTFLEDCFNNKPYTMTVYEKEGKKFLLMYEFKERDGTIDSEQFKGWLSENPVLYKSTVFDVKVYEISGEFPSPVEIKDEHHADFGNLPRFMQSAIQDVSFDISKYRHQEELEFIFGEGGLLETLKTTGGESDDKTDLINKMKSIIQTCIVQEGGSVSISSNREEDKVIKDKINELYEPREQRDSIYKPMEQWDSIYEPLLNKFLVEKDDLTKAKLAFLFGQLAKAGVLGYEHGPDNRGNTLFTALSHRCYARLSEDFKTTHYLMIYNEEEKKYKDSLDQLYTSGACIESTSDTLKTICGTLDLASIWKKDV